MNAVGFWSYSHDDDERDGHALLRLAARIQDEFALVTGESLILFVDRDQISWGEEWRRRIETALAETTFFIPIITPLYFKRPECRRELLSFVGQAQSLGAIELVMPILYVGVPDLTEDSSDEARALVAKMQYTDWCELRLSAEDSAEYRRALNSLALRLAEISNRYEQNDTQRVYGVTEEETEAEEEGLLDQLAVIEEKLPQWQEYIDEGNAIVDQANAIRNIYQDRINRAERQGTSGPVLSVLRTYIREWEPLIDRSIEYVKKYSAASIELDPLILKLLRTLDDYPEFTSRILSQLSPIEDVARGIIEGDAANAKNIAMKEWFRKYKGISKDVTRLYRRNDVYDRYHDDANSLVLNWHESIRVFRLRHQPHKPPGSA